MTVEDMNLEHCTAEQVSEALQRADGFCIGSPTLGGEMPSQVGENKQGGMRGRGERRKVYYMIIQ